jgi:RNA polymerase sigma factor (sigma-70 family)
MLETVEAPTLDGPSDQQLVARVRRGDDRAFETLYRRYHRRISAYVYGMVKDHGRAEDVTQEVFVSALRRMRQTERPIAFKPWIYEIAKNACIDAFRRSRRVEEVSYDADDGLGPKDYGKLVGSGPTPVEAVAAKEDIAHLRGAFGGLSDMHHEILVMRELEGLSYREIGERLGLSRPAVESTLFRARKRLTEEYDELVSGARCLRIQAIIATAGAGDVGVRDSRRLARHVAHCQPCRRLAAGAGLDVAALAPPTRRARVAAKVAGWLPFPIPFLRRPGGGGGGAMAQLAAAGGEPAAAGWAKMAIAAATLLIAGVGAGVGEHAVSKQREAAAESATGGAATRLMRHDAPMGTGAGAVTAKRELAAPQTTVRRGAANRIGDRRQGEGSGGRADAPTGGGGGGTPGGSSGGGDSPSGHIETPSGGGGGSVPKAPGSPKLPDLPLGGGGGGGGGGSLPVQVPENPVQTVTDTADQVTDTADQVTDTVDQTVQDVTQPVRDAVDEVAPGAGDLLP